MIAVDIAAEIRGIASSRPPRAADERELQEWVANALAASGRAYQREAPLTKKDRPDFLVPVARHHGGSCSTCGMGMHGDCRSPQRTIARAYLDLVARGMPSPRCMAWIPQQVLALEIKIGGSTGDLVRQLGRYAAHEAVAEILVVTTMRRHDCPERLSGIPIHVLCLGDYLL